MNMFSSPVFQGYALALGATLLWSTIFLFARGVAGELSPVELAFWRWTLAFLAILPFVWRAAVAKRAILKKHFPYMFLAGFMGFSCYSLVLFHAGKTTETANLALISASAPIFMALFSRFCLGESVSFRQVVGLLIAVSGVVFLIMRGDINRLLSLTFSSGDLWMVSAAIMFAGYSVMVRRRPEGLGQRLYLAALLGYGALGLLPLFIHEIVTTAYSLPPPRMLGMLVFIALAPSLSGYLMWNAAISRIGAAKAGVMYYSVPLFSSLLGSAVLDEAVTIPQIIGGALIIGGILFSSLSALHASRTGAKPLDPD